VIGFARSISAPAIAAVTRSSGPAVPAAHGERNAALDFTKGGLVLCMIAYHTLNYFRYDVRLLRHLHFVPASFIFIAGFLITSVYLPKLLAGDTRVYHRLFVRGLKVSFLFLALNVIVQAFFEQSYNRDLGLGVFLSHLDQIFLTGERHASVFGVLLPIGYLLLLASALLRAMRVCVLWCHVVAVIIFGLCAALAQADLLTFNLELVSMGLIGMVAGSVSRARLDALSLQLPAIMMGYALYAIVTHVVYPTYVINLPGVALSLLLIYALGARLGSGGLVIRQIVLVGNYSLLSYLVQIAALQLLFRIFRAFGVLERDIVVPFVATIFLTFAVVNSVDRFRSRSRAANRAYAFLFA
jgi:hypothetical protein